MTLSTAERIRRDKEKAAQLLNRVQKLEQRQKTKQKKREDHRKFIIGGAMLKLARDDPSVGKQLFEWLSKSVLNRHHRLALGLDPI